MFIKLLVAVTSRKSSNCFQYIIIFNEPYLPLMQGLYILNYNIKEIIIGNCNLCTCCNKRANLKYVAYSPILFGARSRIIEMGMTRTPPLRRPVFNLLMLLGLPLYMLITLKLLISCLYIVLNIALRHA